MFVTITADESVFLSLCDLALRQEGVQALQTCNLIVNEIQRAKIPVRKEIDDGKTAES